MISHNEAIQRCEGLLRLCETSLSRFQRSFEEDPVSAFRWSNDAQQAAALKAETITVVKSLKANSDKAEHVQFLADFLKDEIGHGVRYGTTNSSSPMANLMSQYRLMAMQRIVDLLEEKS